MRHYFLDTNVVIDFLTNRGAFAMPAAELFRAAVSGQASLYVASLSFSNIHYSLRKENTPEERIDKLTKLAQLVQVVGIDAVTVQHALTSAFTDFEDALQYFAAVAVPAIEVIVTRDSKGFRHSTLPVLTPAEALQQLL